MKKKLFAVLALVLAMCMMLCACGSDAADTGDTAKNDAVEYDSMTMGTGGTTGTYYAFGNVLSGFMNEASDIAINVVSTDGSAANIYGIDDGLYQLATVQSDVMAYAWEGSKSFEEDGEIKSFLVIGGLYEEAVQIVTMDPAIKTVADLKGKTVSIGAPNSGVFFNAVDVLEAYGMDYEADIKAEYLSFGDSTDAMKDGKIDAAFIVAGPPTTAIVELATTNDVYLVSIEDDIADKLIEVCPYYNKYTIPADAYGLDTDVQTVSIKATMIVSADASEDAVYDLTAGIFDNIDAITVQHGKGAELSIDNATTGMAVPFHAGAAKYFAEQGITVDAG